ncbi:MAG: hydrogenase 3 maturation endopeptidase HyCI [Candidatus Edwardsbacteria bacterium]|jgi:hydrogenase 3 maturation protease|nr:hydrogenase 3 maturation endopeptidase HyCI [Candidatus Edwardsbacteria bacterium]
MDPEWIDRLRALVAPASNVAVLGIGNELMGDDAAGVLVVRGLSERAAGAAAGRRVSLFECHTTPENYTGALERLKPDLVLMIDAADMGAAVGEIRMLDAAAMGSMMHSTHTMPLSFLAQYIGRTAGSSVVALGIQAGQIMLDRPISPAVAGSVRQAAQAIAGMLSR